MNKPAMQLVLASASPRRAELLRQLHLDFVQIESTVDETVAEAESPSSYVQRLAAEKSLQVSQSLPANYRPALVLGADTCIALDDRILGKPADRDQAMEYLSQLAGREHTVYSAVNLRWQEQSLALVSASTVWMKAMTRSEIEAYCASGEPMDKAGAYAIQGLGAMFIQRINGSYSAIMGLPIYETAELLEQAGIRILRNET